MKTPMFRFKSSGGHHFAGHQINREKRIKFTLNGHKLLAYEGDTILSAALANGFFIAGSHEGSNLALDESLGLCVRLASAPEVPQSALPIARTPALNDAIFVIYGAARAGGRLPSLRRGIASLKIRFDQYAALPPPYSEVPIAQHRQVDMVIVGGGIAGMTAALQAEALGKTVILVERRAYLGGDAELFGHADGEEKPEKIVQRLIAKIARRPNVTVLTNSEAFRYSDNCVYVHYVELRKNVPMPFVMNIQAKNAVFATGCSDKQPLFPGNRLPVVSRLAEAWHLANAYAVVRGGKTLIFTSTNVAYRFASLMHDAGGEILKIIDGRVGPSSRFFEIAKASGIKTESGVKIRSTAFDERNHLLDVDTELVWEGISKSEPIRTEHLIISNGWLQRLNLWRQAGGVVTIQENEISVESQTVPHVKLAGSCAGYQSTTAVESSATVAIQTLLGGSTQEIIDVEIDPAFETPDGPLNINSFSGAQEDNPTYLAAGPTLIARESTPAARGISKIFGGKKVGSDRLADRALSYADGLAMTILGWLPEKELTHILRERAVVPRIFFGEVDIQEGEELPGGGATASQIPPYLLSRLGKNAEVWSANPEGEAPIQIGNLLFASTDERDPLNAVGVIIESDESHGQAFALIKKGKVQQGDHLMARGSAGHRSVSISHTV